jgi:hypothetical protein
MTTTANVAREGSEIWVDGGCGMGRRSKEGDW